MTIVYHDAYDQGSEQWLAARCGLLSASEMKLIITAKTLKVANNDKACAHLHELVAQRITRYVEPRYIGDDMLRGMSDEIIARDLYGKHYGEVREVGLITNDKHGFTLAYSPDGLVGDVGLIEGKSRRQKFQIETIVNGIVPDDFVIQCQTGLDVSEREWLDFISFSGGLPMITLRVWPDPVIQAAIVEAAASFEAKATKMIAEYHDRLASGMRLIPTERTIEQEMFVG